MYQKDVLSIPYNKLKSQGIKVLLFDLDNTLIDKNHDYFNDEIKELLNKLKKEFQIFIVSNTLRKKRVKRIAEDYNIRIITGSLKPIGLGIKRIKELKKYKKEEICMIGDQLMTDVFAARIKGFKSVLVDYQVKDIEKITAINRLIEKHYLKKYNIKRGAYYE